MPDRSPSTSASPSVPGAPRPQTFSSSDAAAFRRDAPPATLPGPVVDAAWLADHLDGVVVADVRWNPDGGPTLPAFEAGHVPGAVPVDLDADLSAPPSPTGGRHPLPEPGVFAATLGRLGIGADDPVVVCDDARGSIAARLWWMLRVLDRPVAVLDGGLDAWTASFPAQLATGPAVERPAVTVPVAPWPSDRFVDADELDRLRVEPTALVIDARAADRYAGAPSPLDPRPGHIPGARSAPWAANVDPDSGRLLPATALRARFEALGAGERGVVASCGSGVTACHDLLALAVAGLLDVTGPTRLFVGSWSAWGADPARPAALGPSPFGDEP